MERTVPGRAPNPGSGAFSLSDSPVGSGSPASEEGAAPARELWGTRWGFVMAAVGSAVGLGNMWRFPYVTSEWGGAAFVVLYIFFVLLVGIPLMLAELTIGRRTHLSPIAAFRKAGSRAWVPVGFLFVLIGIFILSFYSVIAGWTLR